MKGRFILTASVLVSLCLAGCGSKPAEEKQDKADGGQAETAADGQEKEGSDTDSGSRNVSLRFWCDADEMELFQEQIDTFISDHKNEADIKVECEAIGASECKDVFLADVNNGADVFCLPDDQLLTMAASGVLEEVANAEAIAAANLEGAVGAASVEGRLYAYPLTADNGYFLYYDKEYLTEEDVKTLDRILEVCAENGKKFVMDWSSGWYLYSFFGNTGLTLSLNEDGLTNTCDWNKAEGEITGLDVAKGMLSVARNPAFVNDSDFPGRAKDGNAIAVISGVWDIASMKQAFGDDYGACKLPTYTCAGRQVQMSSFTGYRLLGVNSYSQHKEWAEKLAEYLSGEESQTLRFERAERGPSNIKAGDSDAVRQNPAILAVLEQSEYGVLQKVGQKYWAPVANFGAVIAAGNPNNVPLQDLLDEMVSGITE